MPTNFMDLKKCWWGGGGYAKIFYGFEKNVGGGGYAQIFYGLEKMLGGLCQNILWTSKNVGRLKMFGGMQTNFVYGFKKKNWGGGVVMPKYFIDLKKC